MKRETQEKILEDLFAFIENGTSDEVEEEFIISTDVYTNEARTKTEIEVLIENRPVAVGLKMTLLKCCR